MRFPDFNDDWTQTTLGAIAEKKRKKNNDNAISKVYSNSAQLGIIEQTDFFDKEIANSNNLRGYYIVEYLDFIYNPRISSWAPVGAMNLNKQTELGIVSPLYTVFRIDQRMLNPYFVGYLFKSSVWHTYMKQIANYGARDDRMNIKDSDFFALPISLPTLAEQKKIADFLSLIDERIQSCSETIAQMKSLRYGFYNTISHRRKQEWQSSFLRDILTERKENNAMLHEVYSVSVSRGIVNQIEHLGRSFASKDTSHYNTVHFGDIVYTKSPTGKFPYGIVKQSRVKSMVAVSPLYGVYIPDNYHIGAIINSFFESAIRTSNYLAPLIQKGAKNTMNITTQHFLDNKILLPTSLEEQKKIADFLSLIDERIEVEERLLQQYEKQKRYLLKQMFV